jgi:hypothetical protein
MYPVRVYECRGTNPGPTDCYGATMYGADPKLGFQQTMSAPGVAQPELPTNGVIAVTHADGTGSADIEVWTSQQSQSLACDTTKACSLVVEPEYGGDALGYDASLVNDPNGTPNCTDHQYDQANTTATDVTLSTSNYVNGNGTGESCAWSHHVVVPLSFAPTANSCKAANNDLTTAGAPSDERAVQQWRAGACLNSTPLNAGYTSQGEPEARQSFLQGGGADVALVSQPDTGAAPRPYVYTPLANTGISVVFAVDDKTTGIPITQLKLNARLLAKELTQSYSQMPNPKFDPASVQGNPQCIFTDPEFLALNNPTTIAPLKWPSCGSDPNTLPIVLGNRSDLIHQLTAWIAADPDASSFLQGQPDPWGMHVDSYYQRPAYSGYPTDILIPQDTTGYDGGTTNLHEKQYEWSPVLSGLDDAVRDFLLLKPTCSNPRVDGSGSHPHCSAQAPGLRTLFGIMDTADAKAYSMDEAALVNPAGAAVTPSINSFDAAVNDMPLDPGTGTRQLPYGVPNTPFNTDSQAYPLTSVQYAMAPTSGLGNKTAAVGRFLQQVTDPGGGQIYGRAPGQLAPGFSDLTPTQLAEAQAAVQHVTAQDGALPGNQTPSSSPTPTPSASASASASTSTAPVTTQQAPAGSGQQVAPDNGTGGGGSGGGSGSGGTGDSGTTGGSGTSGGGSGGTTGNNATTPATTGATAKASPSPSSSANPSMAPVAAGNPSPDRAGAARLLMPIVLIAGGVLVVGGPAAVVVSGTAVGGRLLSRLRRLFGAG